MNVIRKSLSRIKGGRLAEAVTCKYTRQLLISDVPGDDMGSIGSGLLVPPNRDDDQALQNLDLPDWLHELFVAQPAPDASSPVWKTVESSIIASNEIACTAVANKARQIGLTVQFESGVLNGTVEEMYGSDGPTMDAGGLVDHLTLEAGKQIGLDVHTYLENADCGHYLEKIGALVTTGPTGTNFMDVLIAII